MFKKGKQAEQQEVKPIERDWVENELHWFEHEKLGCKFALPASITVRVHQKWVDARTVARLGGASSNLAIWWHSAVDTIEKWECEAIPDCTVSDWMDSLADDQLVIVAWVGQTVHGFMNGKTVVPKN